MIARPYEQLAVSYGDGKKSAIIARTGPAKIICAGSRSDIMHSALNLTICVMF